MTFSRWLACITVALVGVAVHVCIAWPLDALFALAAWLKFRQLELSRTLVELIVHLRVVPKAP